MLEEDTQEFDAFLKKNDEKVEKSHSHTYTYI